MLPVNSYLRAKRERPDADGGSVMFRRFMGLRPYQESPRVKRDREERKEYAKKHDKPIKPRAKKYQEAPRVKRDRAERKKYAEDKKKGLKLFREHQKWAKDFVKEQAEASGNNRREINQRRNALLKKNPWITARMPKDKFLFDALKQEYPEVK